MTVRTRAASLFAGALLSMVATAPAHAQDASDARWLPFVGCWEAVNSDEGAGLLCFMPANNGVEMFNVAAGQIVTTELLVANGQQRSVSAEGCEGWESLAFSEDGRRAFTRSEFACGTDTSRSGTGIMALTAPNQWVDVRSLDVDGEAVAWVQEYRLAGPDRLAEEGMNDPVAGLGMAVRTSRTVASAPIEVRDVEEAAQHVDAKVLETWLAAQQDRFDLSGADLIRLADSGVPENVIDVMVAVSYPDKFMVQPTGPIETIQGQPARPLYTGYRGYLGYDPFGPRYGLGYSSMYSPFGYYGSGWGYGGGGYYGYRPATVIVDRRPSPEGGGGGRAYKGRGYSQGVPSTGGGSAQPRNGSGPQASTSSGGSSAGSSSGSGSSGSAPPPRRAQRRRPGGG